MQNLGLTFYGDQLKDSLTVYSDSDWAGDPNTRRSVSRYNFVFCGAAIMWSAKKQQTLALSSTEAEYMTHAGKEVVFLMHLHHNIGSPLAIPIPMLVKHQSTITLVENLIFHARSKHIEVRQHWIHEKVEDGVIQLEYVVGGKFV